LARAWGRKGYPPTAATPVRPAHMRASLFNDCLLVMGSFQFMVLASLSWLNDFAKPWTLGTKNSSLQCRNNGLHKGRKIIGFPAGDQLAVYDHLFVLKGCTGVDEIVFDGEKRRDGTALEDLR